MIFNAFKTVTLMILLSLMFIAIGSFFGESGMIFALIMAVVMNTITYFFSDKIVLGLYRAKPLDQQAYKHIHQEVEALTHRMNIPKPKLWLINSPVANAFATGRNPKHASVALTTGILDLLDEDELQGVLAHELSHVKNRDILISTIAATLATSVSYLAYMLRHAAIWGSYSSNRRSGNPFMMFLVGMFMPFAALLVQLAISRSREYQADESGAYITHNPLALASALQKLHNNVRYAHLNGNEQYAPTASMGIVYPFFSKGLVHLFSTHPPMSKRVKRLEDLHRKMF